MGVTDVIPFTPVSNDTIGECIEVAKEVRAEMDSWGIPVYLYEDAASTPQRTSLAKERKGQYETFFEKIKEEEGKPDFGPQVMNVKGGATAVGERITLVAFNRLCRRCSPVLDDLENLNKGASFKGKLDLNSIGFLGHSTGGGGHVYIFHRKIRE